MSQRHITKMKFTISLYVLLLFCTFEWHHYLIQSPKPEIWKSLLTFPSHFVSIWSQSRFKDPGRQDINKNDHQQCFPDLLSLFPDWKHKMFSTVSIIYIYILTFPTPILSTSLWLFTPEELRQTVFWTALMKVQ